MKISAGRILLLLAFAAMIMAVSGCGTNEAQNASVRPWDSPQGWEYGGGMPINPQQQHY
ncbi:MAG TPA: hypothetical protein VHG89_12035 [Verrucomicrobiae bacterium]|nr:hypothetical protein [Verrucomicrobiae bacterium]